MRIVYTRRAIADVEAIANYLTPRSPQGALRVRAAIFDTVGVLSRFPNVGRRQTIKNTRQIGVRAYPYLIYYSVDDEAEEISILTVQHGARQRTYTDQ